MSDTMSTSVKPAVQYVDKGTRRRQARTATVEPNTALEASAAVVLEDSPWKRSKRQGLEKAIAAIGEDELQGVVPHFKKEAA